MKQKSKKKQICTLNQEKQLFSDLQIISPFCLKTLLLWKAEQLFDLNLRISELSAALNKKFGDFPDYEESYRFYSTLSRSTKNNYIGFPVAACAEFKIITMDELNTFVRKDRIDINITHLQKCFEFAQEVLRIKIKEPHLLLLLGAACSVVSLLYRTINENLQEDMLKKFIAIDHLLTTKACEAIGYWTNELEKRKGSKRGGERDKICQPILIAFMKLLKDDPDLSGMPNNHITKEFIEKIKCNPIIINYNHSEWEIYYSEIDKLIFADPDTNYNKKNKITSRSITVIRKTYIPKAKEEIKNKNKK